MPYMVFIIQAIKNIFLILYYISLMYSPRVFKQPLCRRESDLCAIWHTGQRGSQWLSIGTVRMPVTLEFNDVALQQRLIARLQIHELAAISFYRVAIS